MTEAAQKAVDAQTATVTKLNSDATAMGATLDNATRRRLGQARARLEALVAVLTLEQGELKGLNDVLTDTKTVTWPDTGSIMASKDGLKPSADVWRADLPAGGWDVDVNNNPIPRAGDMHLIGELIVRRERS